MSSPVRLRPPPHQRGRDAQPESPAGQNGSLDAEEAVGVLLRDLRTSQEGLTSAEAQRRALQYGPNELRRHKGTNWPAKVGAQLTQPLALLLWVAAAPEFAIGNNVIGIAVVLVILINATMALLQERQAEQPVEALSTYLPERTTVMRDGHPGLVDASELVPGDVILLEKGERVPADVRLIQGAPELDMSALTGESEPVPRSAELVDVGVPHLQATTMYWVGMMAGQIGTTFAVRTRRASLRSVGVFSNPYLLKAIAGVIVFAVLFVYVPALQGVLGTAALPARYVVLLLPYPFIALGAEELRKWIIGRRASSLAHRPAEPAASR